MNNEMLLNVVMKRKGNRESCEKVVKNYNPRSSPAAQLNSITLLFADAVEQGSRNKGNKFVWQRGTWGKYS